MKLALPRRAMTAPALRGARTVRSHGRAGIVVRSMLAPYQYKTRVARLRLKGVHVHEFGERVLQQGSFGDDVMQLQAYLAEQGYFKSDDGLSGYFGDVTGQALQAWQRDQGLRATGVFDANCKWAYLRQQEAAMAAAKAQEATVAVSVRPPSMPNVWRAPSPGLGSNLLGLAALLAGASLARTRLREGRPIPGLAETGRLLRWALHSLAGATASAGRAVQRQLEPPAAPAPRLRRRRPAVQSLDGPAGSLSPSDISDFESMAPLALPARQAAADEAAFLSAAAQPAAKAPPAAKPRRLSEDEVQQRIAVMKGELSPRAPAPQRPAPSKVPLGIPKPADDPITGSKYGTYYGGRQVRDKVKQYLDGDSGLARAATPARRMESIGYPMNSRSRPPSKPAKPAPALIPATVSAPLPSPEVEAVAATEPFRDVSAAEELAGSVAANALLAGTELERSPERRGRPVPVVKPGMALPAAAATPQLSSGAVAAGPAAAPRPVPVVKPQKRATIGDMLRNSRISDGQEAPHLGANGGGIGGHPAAAPQPPQQQGGGRPVNTGSSYPVSTGSSYGGPASGAAAGEPVQYNADGSVVLNGKPIKLVKPAHLLPKTYGFEGAAAQGPQAGFPPADRHNY